MESSDSQFKGGDTAKGDSEADGHERKQRWKEKPGNRYTPEELRAMAQDCDSLQIIQQEFHLMCLD